MSENKYNINDLISCRFSDGELYTGKIIDYNESNHTYSVLFDDGEEISDLKHEQIELIKNIDEIDIDLTIGMKIFCKYDDDFYPGVIQAIHENGFYQILFDDGDIIDDATINDIKIITNENDNLSNNSSTNSSINDNNNEDNDNISSNNNNNDDDDDDDDLDNYNDEYEDESFHEDDDNNNNEEEKKIFHNRSPSRLTATPSKSPSPLPLTKPLSPIPQNHEDISEIYKILFPTEPDYLLNEMNLAYKSFDSFTTLPPHLRLIYYLFHSATIEHAQWFIESMGHSLSAFTQIENNKISTLYKYIINKSKMDEFGEIDDDDDDDNIDLDNNNNNNEDIFFPKDFYNNVSLDVIPIQNINDLLTNIRTRTLALSRICYGDISLDYIQILCNLGLSYSIAGMWSQVSDHMSKASQLLISLSSSLALLMTDKIDEDDIKMESKSYQHGFLLSKLFQLLKRNAMRNNGYILKDTIIESLKKASLVHYPESFINEVNNFYNNNNNNNNQSITYGEFITNLRINSKSYQLWCQTCHHSLSMVQIMNIWSLFFQCDYNKNGTVNGVEFYNLITFFPISVLIIDSLNLKKKLKDLTINSDDYITLNENNEERTYKFALLWEEIICEASIFISPKKQVSILRTQILILLSKCQLHTGKISSAIETLLQAGQEFSQDNNNDNNDNIELPLMLQCEIELCLYDVLMRKMKLWPNNSKKRAEKKGEKWINSEDGISMWRREVKKISKQARESGKRMPLVEIEYRVREAILQARIQYEKDHEKNHNQDDSKNAKDHLLLAWQKLEAVFGRGHPAMAHLYLKLSELEYFNNNIEEAINHLKSSLNIFKLSFGNGCLITAKTCLQISKLLKSLNNERESIELLTVTARFFSQNIKDNNNKNNNKFIPANTISYKDINENNKDDDDDDDDDDDENKDNFDLLKESEKPETTLPEEAPILYPTSFWKKGIDLWKEISIRWKKIDEPEMGIDALKMVLYVQNLMDGTKYSKNYGKLLIKLSKNFQDIGDFPQAKENLMEAKDIFEKCYGPESKLYRDCKKKLNNINNLMNMTKDSYYQNKNSPKKKKRKSIEEDLDDPDADWLK